MRGEKGFALVITLIVTMLLVALLAEFVNDVYVDTSHSHNFVATQQAAILAESGVAGGVKLLQIDLARHPSYSSLQDLWAKPQSYDAGEGTVTVTIEEETAKLNLNNACNTQGVRNDYTDIASRLINRLQLSPDLVETLVDWVDENDTPHPGGAETTYYGALKIPYNAKNAPLETVEELQLLKGFTPEALTKLKGYVTVYGAFDTEPFTKININTAPKEVIASLDDKLSESLVERILDYRKTKVIKTLADIPGMDTFVMSLQGKVGFRGAVYRVRSEGRVGESVSVAEAVVRVGEGFGAQPAVLYWREY